jgi:hypothetical protein
MDKLKNLWEEIVYQLDKFGYWLNWKFPYKKRARIRKALREILLYVTVVLLVVLIFKSYQPVETQKYEITYNITEAQATEQTVEPKTELGKAIKEMIKTECKRQGVDINLVYAIINSEEVNDGTPRYGIMKLHPDLIKKYDANYRDGVGVVESIHSNMESGIKRLKWATENNETIESALMVYIYTKPEAQKMWADGIKTTKWVEEVKREM